MKNAIKSVHMVLCGGAIALSALAESTEYVLQKSDSAVNAQQWSADGGATLVTPDEAPEGSVFKVAGRTVLSANYTMPGTLVLGTESSTGDLNASADGCNDFLTANIKWVNGDLYNNKADSILTVSGRVEVASEAGLGWETKKLRRFGAGDGEGIILAADLVSEDDSPVIKIGHAYSASQTFDEVNDSYPASRMCLMGDNSGYKGTFRSMDASQTRRVLILGGNEPLGDPNTPTNRALYIGSYSYVLGVASDGQQSASRGIYYNSSDVNYFGAWKGSECDGHTLSYPIKCNNGGTRGKFIKVGDGTFRINNTISCVEIAVSNGTFAVGKDTVITSSMTSGSSKGKFGFVVGEGAKLRIEPGAKLPESTTITKLNGGEVVYEYQPIVVPFDGTNSTPVTVTDTIGGGYVQPVVFSQPFDIPFSATNRVAALVIPNGNYTEADFRDDTPKAAYGLPTTWVELEKDEATGDQTLYVVARPAVASTANNKIYTLNEWSDGSSPHLGADYYQFDCAGVARRTTTGSYSSGAVTFNGSSLTLAGENSKTVSYSGAFNVSDFRLWPLATVNFNAGSSTKDVVGGLGGNLSVCGDVSTWGNPSVLYSGNYMANIKLSMKMGGAGAVRYYSGNTKSTATVLTISGDNSAFGGQWIFEEHNDAGSFVEVVVTNGAAFGGALTRFADNAVTITTDPSKTVSRQTERVVISPTASMTVDAANRGWMTTCGCGFRMPAGVTLTFAPPRFTVGGEIRKDGAGTWAFACGELVAADAAKLTVAEGAISQLKEGCLSELPIVFAGGGICVDVNADAGAKEKGIVAKSFALAEGTETIPVTFANLPDVRTASATEVHVTILTAPAGSPEFQFVAKAPKGYKVTLTSAPGEDGATVYSADLVPKGVLLIVR